MDPLKVLLEAEKQRLIQEFNRDPTKAKAYRLFHKYGTDLPANIINYIRDEARKYVEQEAIKKSDRKAESNAIMKECYIDIHWHGMSCTEAYEKHSNRLGISESAFQKRYLRIYPPTEQFLIFPEHLTLK